MAWLWDTVWCGADGNFLPNCLDRSLISDMRIITEKTLGWEQGGWNKQLDTVTSMIHCVVVVASLVAGGGIISSYY